MAYKPFYQITDWQSILVQKMPINKTNLPHVEDGIKEASNRIIHFDTEKLEKSEANLMAKSAVVDAETDVITITLLNGTVYTYDLDIECVAVNFDITDGSILILTSADGTKEQVDLARFVYSFPNTATITMKMIDRKVTAKIVDGSVTMVRLDSSIQSTFLQYFLDAESARDLALQYQKNAKRYAIGDVEFDGGETGNAGYYCDQSKKYSKIAQEVVAVIYPNVYVDIGNGHLLAIDGNNFCLSLDLSGHLIFQIGSGEIVWL